MPSTEQLRRDLDGMGLWEALYLAMERVLVDEWSSLGVSIARLLFSAQPKLSTIHSSPRKEVSQSGGQSEIKISIIFFWLGLLVRPSIHFYTKMLIFNVNLRFKYLTVFECDFRLK